MALKRKINQATYDGLSDTLKFEYKKAKDDEFVLDVDDATELLNARDLMKRERDEARNERDTYKAENVELKKSNGNWDTMEASYKSKLADKDTQLEKANTDLTKMRRQHHTADVAKAIAGKFSVPDLVLDKVLARLDIKTDKDGNVSTVVLDKDGKVSAGTVDDLTKEFLDNPAYKPIVIKHQGSGSATGGLPAAPGNTQQTETPKLIHQMTPEQVAADRKARKEAAAANA